ncbi:MAG: hypothetical protein GTO63_29685 [Anaerolineae bacterium]|nr:hypothetical protein [Anaerolineae bacterium]NIN98888.1 hypothetical protein [Anaerolineae bacterium]NIQ81799.1 hypothetical protein [Anaerolineae bacterium]
MMEDLRGTVSDARGSLEKLVGAIPGYRGYKEKEMRREADKLLRMHLSRRFEEQRSKLSNVQNQLASEGKLQDLGLLERTMLQLQLLIDRLKVAEYGYAGLFDAVRVKEEQLDALYIYDNALTTSVEQLAETMDKVAIAAMGGEELRPLANDALLLLQELNTTLDRRKDVILTAGESV